MSQTSILVVKIVAMFLVILFGWLVRRRAILDERMTATLSWLTTDITLPALIFTQLIATVSRDTLGSDWVVPVMAAGVLLLGQLVGWLGWRAFATPPQARTFIFCVMMANWIYLPLPIVQELYGPPGVRTILLCNVGVQIVLWTSGVATLRGGRIDLRTIFAIARNPGMIATVLGILAATLTPQLVHNRVAAPFVEALGMIGSLTIPLALIATGAQLGGVRRDAVVARSALSGIVILRLIVVPAIALAGFWLLQSTPLRLPVVTVMCGFLIAAMPVAISTSILTQRYQQHTELAAQSIFITQLLSIVTVPAMFWIAAKVIHYPS